jgi:SAM-dependent methyltransferase
MQPPPEGNIDVTTGKADFTDIYQQPDPRGYYETLCSLDYEIPAHGCNVFTTVLGELRNGDGDTPTVLDVCCSYGVNAALLNHNVSLEEIEAHYAQANGMPSEQLLERDRAWFGARRRPDAFDVVGVDISEPAVRYAVDVGLLVDGVVADLETQQLSERDAAKLSEVDLVTVTGGIGYIKERTFEQILDAADETPWVAALSLRWVDFDPIAETLEQQGLVTERLDGYVARQRRFADSEEREFVFDELAARGIEPTNVEVDGHHGAELYLARPADAVQSTPLDDLFDRDQLIVA